MKDKTATVEPKASYYDDDGNLVATDAEAIAAMLARGLERQRGVRWRDGSSPVERACRGRVCLHGAAAARRGQASAGYAPVSVVGQRLLRRFRDGRTLAGGVADRA